MMGLGYVSKTGNILQDRTFTHRGVDLDPDPEVYRFNYQVKSVEDGIKYFQKSIDENILSDKELIVSISEKKNTIGRWLLARPTLLNTLQKLEHVYKFNYKNSQKKGFTFAKFTEV